MRESAEAKKKLCQPVNMLFTFVWLIVEETHAGRALDWRICRSGPEKQALLRKCRTLAI